jgi:hypothetical protein
MLCLELGLLSADGASQGGPSEKDILAREDAFSEKDLCAKQRNKSSSHVLNTNSSVLPCFCNQKQSPLGGLGVS